jgi:hypothetical protein
MTPPTRGFLVIADGPQAEREVVLLLRSLQRHHPGDRVLVYTQAGVPLAPHGEFRPIPPELQGTRNYVRIHLVNTFPFDRTIVIDSDTWLCAPLDELFDVLDKYDYACKLAENRDSRRYFEIPGSSSSVPVPDCFPERNAGLIAYRRSPACTRLFARWEELYRADYERTHGAPVESRRARDMHRDQPTLRQAMYESDARELILGNEWNLTIVEPCLTRTTVRVIHARLSLLESGRLLPDARTFQQAESILNQTTHYRLIWPGNGVHPIPPTWKPLLRLWLRVTLDAAQRVLRRLRR